LKGGKENTSSSLDKAVKVTLFLKDINNLYKISKVYKHYFTKDSPARCCVEVAKLPMDSKQLKVFQFIY